MGFCTVIYIILCFWYRESAKSFSCTIKIVTYMIISLLFQKVYLLKHIFFTYFSHFIQIPLPPPIKRGMADPQPLRRFPGRHPPLLTPPAHLLKPFRHFDRYPAQFLSLRLGRRDPFRLPLADIIPLRLRHIGQDLQHQIGNKHPRQIPLD